MDIPNNSPKPGRIVGKLSRLFREVRSELEVIGQAPQPAVYPTFKPTEREESLGARTFGNLRNSRLGSLRYDEQPQCSETAGSPTRFTLDGSEELERWLALTCDQVVARILAAVSPQLLEGVVLGGGYGRGEGGVLQAPKGDQPYNDLEFYVFLRGLHCWNERALGQKFHSLAHSLSSASGIEVEFKILTINKLRRSATSMFYYDLIAGHRLVWGRETLFAGCEHHGNPARIPLAEATRLLMNRCTGLLLAKERLRRELFTADDADFVGRNIAKAQLALGDAVLTMYGQYHWSCRERATRVADVGNMPRRVEIQRCHAEGVRFKLHPSKTAASREDLAQRHAEISSLAREVWLWVEGRRLGRRFVSVEEYAMSLARKCPEFPRWRNSLMNLKNFGPRMLFSPEGSRHPRERVLKALALLLWAEPVEDPRLVRCLQTWLGTSAAAFDEKVRMYRELWERVA